MATMLTSQGDWGPIASVEQTVHNTQGTEGHFHKGKEGRAHKCFKLRE